MKKSKKLFAVISAAAIMTSFSAGIYNASAVTTLGYMKDEINISDYEPIDKGTIQIKKGRAETIPSSLDAYYVEIEDESIGKLAETSAGPCYGVFGLEIGTTKVTLVPFYPNDKKYIYTIEVIDEASSDLTISESEVSIELNEKHQLFIKDPESDDNNNDKFDYTCSYAEWFSDNESVVTVVKGMLYPKSVGTATVTALLNGVEYKSTVTVDAPVYEKGDITKDGRIDLFDAIEIAKHMCGKVEFTEEEMKIADYNGDGSVGLQDAIGIAKYMSHNRNKK